ncbi:MAG: glycosyltransferase [Sedimentisphaerales bacterium]|nr:glycosyltransferase [Sedimentisphaerales bacterium]
MRIALVCDWLTGMRGGERCLEAVCELYPKADIYTLVHFPGTVSSTIESHKIHTSYIQRLPRSREKFRRYLPIFPNAIRRFDLRGYDCVLSFSHCVAKGAAVPAGIPHICYCHTPMRYAWHMRADYLNRLGYIRKRVAVLVLDYLRRWDRKTSYGVTHFIATSRNIQNRLRNAYGRESVIIHPPVDCDRFAVSDANDGYYLIVSALVPYKRVDLAIRAFDGLARELVVVGNGPELHFLKESAPTNVTFVHDAGDREVVEYMERCRALIFPGEEDFGIVPLEAQACGKGVIAFGKGGAMETVVGFEPDGEPAGNPTGIFFGKQSPMELRKTILRFEEIEEQFDKQACRSNALRFDRPVYKQLMRNFVQSVVGEHLG